MPKGSICKLFLIIHFKIEMLLATHAKVASRTYNDFNFNVIYKYALLARRKRGNGKEVKANYLVNSFKVEIKLKKTKF